LRVTFDSNILVYTLSQGDPRHAIAASLLARATRGNCVQTLQSLAECFRVLVTRLRLDPQEAREEIDGFRAAFPVCAADDSDLVQAMRAVAVHRLSFWDAMLWATARRAGCNVLFSEDLQDGRRLDGVLFVNPFAPENQKLVDLALPALPRT
jgi:predicted nucleic acid-binding protein